ncbi:MAG: TonB-dependent receptor [Nitrospira sp.]
MHRLCRLVLFLCALGLPSPFLYVLPHSASAQDIAMADQQETIEVRDVVVSATKTPIPVGQVTSAVEVITGEELEQKKIKTVIDGLRLSSGVFATSSGGPGTDATVKMRGAFARHTLVMIDGVIVNSPSDGSYNFANLTAENIERIEILRGAQSMLYGSDAIGGVISIYTKKGTGKPTVGAFMEYGSFATFREGGHVSGAKGPFDFSASVSRSDTSNFSAINYRRGAFEGDGFHNWQVSAKLGAALPQDGRVEFNMRWYDSRTSFDGFAGTFPSTPADVFGARSTTRNLVLNGTWTQPLTPWWTTKLVLSQANERLISESGRVGFNVVTRQPMTAIQDCFLQPDPNVCFTPFSTNLETLNRRLEWQNDFQIGKVLLLSAGYQLRRDEADSPGFYGTAEPTRTISSNAGFAQAQINLWDRLFLTAGGRHDSYNKFGDATTYRVTGGYLVKETGTKLRGSYATGFKAPTLNDLYFEGFGNPNLKPEKSLSMDLGVEQSLFNGRLQLNAGYFWNRFQNLIQFAFGIPPCPSSAFTLSCPVNVADAKTQGWEFGFKAEILKGLELRGQYTYTLTRAFDTAALPFPLGGDKRLPRWPVDQATVGLTYQPIESLRLNIDYRFVGARNDKVTNVPSEKLGVFNIVNLSASYDVTKNWQAYIRVDNLFNEKYEEILYFGTPIRSIFGGVRVNYDLPI